MTSVVIVDDENNLVEVLSELMNMNKVDVLRVGYDGKQAVELCTKHNPDYLILDLTMPEFDGFYVLEKLQDTKIKIIVLTGRTDIDFIKKLERFSILTIQTKPLNFDVLLNLFNP